MRVLRVGLPSLALIKFITPLHYDLVALQWFFIHQLQGVNNLLTSFILPKYLTSLFIQRFSFSLLNSALGYFALDVLVECRFCFTVDCLLLLLACNFLDTYVLPCFLLFLFST